MFRTMLPVSGRRDSLGDEITGVALASRCCVYDRLTESHIAKICSWIRASRSSNGGCPR